MQDAQLASLAADALPRLAAGRMPGLALDMMLGTRLAARGYANHSLKARLMRLAEGFAAEWRSLTPAALEEGSAAAVRDRIAELAEAERLGQTHPALAHAVRHAASHHMAPAVLGFDALRGPAPDSRTSAGWRAFAKALVHAYAAQRAGVRLEPPTSVGHVLRWLPRMRADYVLPRSPPIAAADGTAALATSTAATEPSTSVGALLGDVLRLAEQAYAVAHVLLVLRDFEAPRLHSRLLPLLEPELRFVLSAMPRLQATLGEAAVDVVSELLDGAKALGQTEASDATGAVRDAAAFVRRGQRADGTWGDGDLAYHTTIAAMWALRDGTSPLSMLGRRQGDVVASQLVEDGVWALSTAAAAAAGGEETCQG